MKLPVPAFQMDKGQNNERKVSPAVSLQFFSSKQKAPQREGIATNVIWEKIELLFKVSTVSQWNAARRSEVSAAPRGVMDIK